MPQLRFHSPEPVSQASSVDVTQPLSFARILERSGERSRVQRIWHLAHKRLQQADIRNLPAFQGRQALLQQRNNVCHVNRVLLSVKGYTKGVRLGRRAAIDG